MKRLSVQGFIILDYASRFGEALVEMQQWFREGKIKYTQEIVSGLENAPQAIHKLFNGDKIGKLLIKVSSSKIIELDISTTQNRKKKCLKKAQIDMPKHVTLVPINLNKESLKNVREKAGYKNNEKTLFIWEGVNYYLEPESVDATWEFVKNSSDNESLIAFDYAISISEANINNYYRAKEFAQTWEKYHSNEPFIFTIDEGKIESFLELRGLKIVNHLDNKEIEKKFLLNENGSLIGQVTGSFRLAMASPNNAPQNK